MNHSDRLGRAIAGLPPGQRDAFLWRVRDDASLAAIAARLGTAPESAGALLVGAARRLAPLHGALPGDYTWLPECRAVLRSTPPVVPTATRAPSPSPPPRWLAGAGMVGVLLGLAVIGWPWWTEWRTSVPTRSAVATQARGPAPALPVEDADAPPLAAADLQLLVDAGDDHALLDDLEFFVWLAERTPDAE